MLTNRRDALRGQSRSPNIVQFHMLGIFSSCAIVTSSLRCAVFPIFDLKKCRDLENQVRGPSRSLEMSPCDRAHMSRFSDPPYISTRCDVGTLGSLSLVSSEPACTCSLRGAVLSVADLFLAVVLARRFTCDIGCEL